MAKHNNRPHRPRPARAPAAPAPAPAPAADIAAVLSASASASTSASSASSAADAVPLVARLAAPAHDDRSWAAAAVANLLADAPSRLALIRAGIASALVTRLLEEPDASVRADVAGALANLAAFGASDVRAELVHRNAVPALLKAIADAAAATSAQPDVDSPAIVAHAICTFEQCVSTLWCLSEESELAVKEASESRETIALLCAPLTSSIDSHNPAAANDQSSPYSLVTVCLQCLNTLSEGNPAVANFFKSRPDLTSILLSIAEGSPLPTQFLQATKKSAPSAPHAVSLVRVLSASILVNISLSTPKADTALISIETLSQAISRVLDLDFAGMCAEVVAIASNGVVDNSFTTAAERTFDAAKVAVNALQLGLEVLANAYSEEYVAGDGEDEEEEEEEGLVNGDVDAMIDDDEDGHDNAFEEMMEDKDLAATISAESGGVNGLDDNNAATAVRSTVDRITAIEKHSMIEKVLRVCQVSTIQLSAITAESPVYAFVDSAARVKVRAFGSLQNILTCLSANGKGRWYMNHNSATVCNIWSLLFDAANSAASGVSNTESIVESAVGAIWALARGADACEAKHRIFLNPTRAQIDNLVSAASMPGAPASLSVKCINTLGILAKPPATVLLNQIIGTFLMEVATSPGAKFKLEAVSEALNAIYDVYGDAEYAYDGPVFVKGGYLRALRDMLPRFRARVKGCDKRKFRTVRDRADEALLNLGAFIAYKEAEARKGAFQ
ncbi:hypothetical protein HDU83_007750 [Entophlyctis luteolus]|nr:hypothetical protein HDU83_007750 [Entophlyctis luteolus]